MHTALPSEQVMYQALVDRDSGYEGVFIVAVKTTGIFCRPTCRARKPRRENVEYFAGIRDAMSHGYRPCKLCRPLELPGTVPSWLRELLALVHDDPGIRMHDADLRERGIEPARLRRWFKQHHGMTFHAYLRSLRVNRAFNRIRAEDTVTESAFDSGFESLSGFSGAFRKTTGFSPSGSRERQLITAARIPTPLGAMLAGVLDDRLCLLEFTDRRMLETQINRLRQRLRAELAPGDHPLLRNLEGQLGEYFAGKRREFDLPLLLSGTEFQRRAWEVLRSIPYGTTRSYRQQADLLGQPAAVRAVARANGDNRIAIIIPCHRVVGSDGKLTGYGGGLWRKRHLLELEREQCLQPVASTP